MKPNGFVNDQREPNEIQFDNEHVGGDSLAEELMQQCKLSNENMVYNNENRSIGVV